MTVENKSDTRTKHIMISGGSRGLGFELCRHLLSRGYSVSTFSRTLTASLESLLGSHEGRCFYRSLDITDTEALKLFVDAAYQWNGDFYGLINNSAVAQDGVLATLPEVEIANA